MNALVAILSTVISAAMVAFTLKLGGKIRALETENKILWEQVRRYETYIGERAAEDQEKQRAAIRN